ncbi:DUF2569 family protein [Candidatus Sodalis pierantonius]|uniref:DUF2569 family protein n=1 Tax=Candidatus Sodalis pierantonii TaxID=1486991 RepID=UPI003AA7D9C3
MGGRRLAWNDAIERHRDAAGVSLVFAAARRRLDAGRPRQSARLGAMWLFTFWLLRLLFRRSRRFPRLLILWLLVGILLGIKTFAFAPVSDNLALRVLFPPVLAAAVLVPYMKRSQRVRQTFILP